MKKKKEQDFCRKRKKFCWARVIITLALIFVLSPDGWGDTRPEFMDLF